MIGKESKYKGVFFDLGGVVFSSPMVGIFGYEEELGLPKMTLAKKIAYHSGGLISKLETGEWDTNQFAVAIQEVCAKDGIVISGKKLVHLMEQVQLRPAFVQTIINLRKNGYFVGAITNNWKTQNSSVSEYFFLSD
eukprot:TRINITY_DN11595_c0_g1_i1.p1 TRINITY_DN11595_c0_g1~~TRINITY_DN11595_c0_g1_i1.p1  ORF type:complete len:136 (+),score=30.24 TRINITY_DN11595_c0_g1_i1:15-422(+)